MHEMKYKQEHHMKNIPHKNTISFSCGNPNREKTTIEFGTHKYLYSFEVRPVRSLALLEAYNMLS